VAGLRGKRVVPMCYDCDTARVASSVLRARGIAADGIR
jgi:hypothetical protein